MSAMYYSGLFKLAAKYLAASQIAPQFIYNIAVSQISPLNTVAASQITAVICILYICILQQ
jgi:hypothetical protein